MRFGVNQGRREGALDPRKRILGRIHHLRAAKDAFLGEVDG